MRVLFLIFFIGLFFPAFSREKEKNLYDTSCVELKKISVQHEAKVFSDREFIYDTNVKPSKSWFDIFWEWLMKMLGKPIEKSPRASYNAMRIFFIVLFIVGVVFLLYKSTFAKALSKNSKSIESSSFADLPDDIEGINVNELIQQAIQNKNYRLAVRWCFLQVLQTLNRQSIIAWQPSKTNQEYLYELNEISLQENFKNFSRVFDNVWYGEKTINEFDCIEYKNRVESFIANVERK
jgi:cbb3-type cytochrome oxidase subunit 3